VITIINVTIYEPNINNEQNINKNNIESTNNNVTKTKLNLNQVRKLVYPRSSLKPNRNNLIKWEMAKINNYHSAKILKIKSTLNDIFKNKKIEGNKINKLKEISKNYQVWDNNCNTKKVFDSNIDKNSLQKISLENNIKSGQNIKPENIITVDNNKIITDLEEITLNNNKLDNKTLQ